VCLKRKCQKFLLGLNLCQKHLLDIYLISIFWIYHQIFQIRFYKTISFIRYRYNEFLKSIVRYFCNHSPLPEISNCRLPTTRGLLKGNMSDLSFNMKSGLLVYPKKQMSKISAGIQYFGNIVWDNILSINEFPSCQLRQIFAEKYDSYEAQ